MRSIHLNIRSQSRNGNGNGHGRGHRDVGNDCDRIHCDLNVMSMWTLSVQSEPVGVGIGNGIESGTENEKYSVTEYESDCGGGTEGTLWWWSWS